MCIEVFVRSVLIFGNMYICVNVKRLCDMEKSTGSVDNELIWEALDINFNNKKE